MCLIRQPTNTVFRIVFWGTSSQTFDEISQTSHSKYVAATVRPAPRTTPRRRRRRRWFGSRRHDHYSCTLRRMCQGGCRIEKNHLKRLRRQTTTTTTTITTTTTVTKPNKNALKHTFKKNKKKQSCQDRA